MPDQQPATDNIDQKRRYRLFMAIEVFLIRLTVGLAILLYGLPQQNRIPLLLGAWVALMMWHVVAIPICIFYLMGNPIVMTLSPLIPSAESRRYLRELRERLELTDDDFYAQFYQGSNIPKEIPTLVRSGLAKIDPVLARAIPSDNLILFDDEMDFDFVLKFVGREFGTIFKRKDYKRFNGKLDGTLDNLIQLAQLRYFSPEFKSEYCQ